MLPQELISQSRWVYASPASKVPVNCRTGRAASTSDKTSWCDYDYAVRHLPIGYYLGYVFTDDDNIIGIDIDKGFLTDGCMAPEAIDIMFAAHSYTETSRSGRGFHIFLRGSLPFEGMNNRNGVEIYRTGRYFICTGNTRFYDKLIQNQAGLDYIVKKYFSKQKEQLNFSSMREVFYKAEWKMKDGKIPLKPHYPKAYEGCRNDSMTSLAGQLRIAGYSDEDILTELRTANKEACDPPLPEWELKQICKSIKRYAR